ncbi:MAG: undecaprenyldiphospho-muramoylpentapeptide beta-N-acetylglucosaminyltransferase [bacterium]|jgi:UDP-N-acetylglucosamine--N-acetylmuramyl-(pentapeptide) pyrophosphoryl-undecaprenol N-acetylglucosamine transferase|nr:undecaprenyldiphospho-muramoylpentapeptide beta-N-acetylglucosaminyltransferase [Betaproteobacteria bacterium]
MSAPRTLMVMAGGTGGHIFPALAVAQWLRSAGWNVVWLGSPRGMESTIVPQYGFEIEPVRFGGVRGKGALRLLRLPIDLNLAFWQCARVIFRRRPDVVLGMGGYIAFPGGMMASLLRRPLVIHEQNSVPGLANRVLARIADRVLCAFPGALGRSVDSEWTGNPVREGIAAVAPPAERFADRSGPLRLLVIGGSLGAQALNTCVPAAIARLPIERRPVVVHQSGRDHLDALQEHYARAGVEATLLPFIDDMALRYAEADLVIARAGATTIAELACVGLASVLVPFPHAVDDHQTVNARFLVERGAAWLIPQPECTPERLAAELDALDRPKLLEMAQRAREVAKPEATRRVAEVCMELAHAS